MTSLSRAKGFSILEMLLSVAIFSILMTAGLGMVGSQAELAAEIRELQDESSTRLQFVETCRKNLELLDVDSQIAFDIYDRGSDRADTYLSLIQTPGIFAAGLEQHDRIDRVVLATESNKSGFARVGVYYLSEEEYLRAKEVDFVGLDQVYVELLPQVSRLTWRFFHPTRKSWEAFIDRRSPPTMIELTIRTEPTSATMRSVFWTPALTTP